MPRRLSTNAVAPAVATGEVVAFPAPVKAKNPAAQALGRLGGSKGGTIRAQRLSSEQKVAIARQGAQARWAKARIKKEVEASASHLEGGSERS